MDCVASVRSSPRGLHAGYVDVDLELDDVIVTTKESGCRVGRAASSDAYDGKGVKRSTPEPHLLGRPDKGVRDPHAEVSPQPVRSLPTVLDQLPDLAEETEEVRLIGWARRVSVFSILISAVFSCLGLAAGIAEEAESLMGLGLEAFLCGLATAMVLWRFKRPKSWVYTDTSSARTKETMEARRERRGTIGIAWTLLAGAASLVLFAVVKLTALDEDMGALQDEEREVALLTELVAWPAVVVFGGLSLEKFRIGRSLESSVLLEDTVSTVACTTVSLISALAALLRKVMVDRGSVVLWPRMVDAVISLALAACLLFEGARTLWLQSHAQGNLAPRSQRSLP